MLGCCLSLAGNFEVRLSLQMLRSLVACVILLAVVECQQAPGFMPAPTTSAALSPALASQAKTCATGPYAMCRTCKPQQLRTRNNECQDCNGGFKLNTIDSTCQAFTCILGNGCKACKPLSARTADNQCGACNSGYRLVNQACKATTSYKKSFNSYCTTNPANFVTVSGCADCPYCHIANWQSKSVCTSCTIQGDVLDSSMCATFIDNSGQQYPGQWCKGVKVGTTPGNIASAAAVGTTPVNIASPGNIASAKNSTGAPTQQPQHGASIPPIVILLGVVVVIVAILAGWYMFAPSKDGTSAQYCQLCQDTPAEAPPSGASPPGAQSPQQDQPSGGYSAMLTTGFAAAKSKGSAMMDKIRGRGGEAPPTQPRLDQGQQALATQPQLNQGPQGQSSGGSSNMMAGAMGKLGMLKDKGSEMLGKMRGGGSEASTAGPPPTRTMQQAMQDPPTVPNLQQYQQQAAATVQRQQGALSSMMGSSRQDPPTVPNLQHYQQQAATTVQQQQGALASMYAGMSSNSQAAYGRQQPSYA